MSVKSFDAELHKISVLEQYYVIYDYINMYKSSHQQAVILT